MENIQNIIMDAFQNRDAIGAQTTGEVRDSVDYALRMLDAGEWRIAEKIDGNWQVNEWLKMAILLSFRLNDMTLTENNSAGDIAYDKVPLKFDGWQQEDFQKAGFRVVSGAVVRHSSFIDKGAVIMPSFINLGANIGRNTMIDTWATIGSCAQIGSNVHISGGVGIGGVLEPLQAAPVIIEDNCFIGARSEVAEGVIVRKDAVLSMGVYLGASTKIIDRETGEIHVGEVPQGAVVVPGTMAGKPLPNGEAGPNLYAAVIVKKVDERTRAKTSINELLRD